MASSRMLSWPHPSAPAGSTSGPHGPTPGSLASSSSSPWSPRVQLWLAGSVVWVRSVPWSVLVGGALVNAGVTVVWILSRTTGVPFQPESMASMDAIMNRAISDPSTNRGAMSHQETFGLLDSAASALQVVVVMAVLVLWLKYRSQGVESGTDETTDNEADGVEDSPATVSREVR